MRLANAPCSNKKLVDVHLTLKETIMNAIKKFIKDEAGVTAIEYGLIAALIAVVIIAAVKLIGTNLDLTFDKVAAEL